MRLLELFSGTHSIGKVAKELGWDVISLDLDDATINCDILEWDYKVDYKPGDFDVIWASPPCTTFSMLRRSWIGKSMKAFGMDTIVTAEMLYDDMIENGLPILRKTEEIIDHFQPKYWFIENPRTGKMKDYITEKDYYDVDYCRYAPEWGYKKPTRIWTNLKGFEPKRCQRKGKHTIILGGKDCGYWPPRREKYRVPPALIRDLFNHI